MTPLAFFRACCGLVLVSLPSPSSIAFTDQTSLDVNTKNIEDVARQPGQPPLPDPLEAGWRGKKICEKLIEDEQHRILRCVFPPGGGHERHNHAPHSGYVIKGGLMRIKDKRGVREVDIKTGSSWTSDGVDWHEVVNIGDTTASYLIIEIKSQ